MDKVAAEVKTHTLVVLVLTVGNVFKIRTYAAETDDITTRMVTTTSSGLAIAVGLTVVGIVAVLAKVEVELVHVVVAALRKMCKMMSLAASVEDLAVLVRDLLVAHVVLQVVTRMLELPDTMDC